MAQYMLTTVDNPFDPFTQFREWYVWDEAHGYHTTGLLARVVKMSDELSDAQQESVINDGIDEVVRENVSSKHIKVRSEL